ncbi:hypothetical protein PM082_021981 [Marasmius tenuissimus]|nr:hypothetical protein PM082_021981 [Marasmius tenuissimus]
MNLVDGWVEGRLLPTNEMPWISVCCVNRRPSMHSCYKTSLNVGRASRLLCLTTIRTCEPISSINVSIYFIFKDIDRDGGLSPFCLPTAILTYTRFLLRRYLASLAVSSNPGLISQSETFLVALGHGTNPLGATTRSSQHYDELGRGWGIPPYLLSVSSPIQRIYAFSFPGQPTGVEERRGSEHAMLRGTYSTPTAGIADGSE